VKKAFSDYGNVSLLINKSTISPKIGFVWPGMLPDDELPFLNIKTGSLFQMLSGKFKQA